MWACRVTFPSEGCKYVPWNYLSHAGGGGGTGGLPLSAARAKPARSKPSFACATSGWGLVGAPRASLAQSETPGTAKGRWFSLSYNLAIAAWPSQGSPRGDSASFFSPPPLHTGARIFLTWISQIEAKRERDAKTKTFAVLQRICGRVRVENTNLGRGAFFSH